VRDRGPGVVVVQVPSTTDARGETLFYVRDVLGRAVELREDSAVGALRASWAYDTLAKGLVSSATRHDAGGDYTTAVTGYDDGYRPLGQSVTLPATEGTVAGTWTTTYAYAPNGQLVSMSLPAAGGLGAETVTTHYDGLSVPEWMSGGDGFGTYVAGSAYSAFGEALAYDLGAGSSVAVGYAYEYGTRRLDRTWVSRAGGSGFDLDLTYSYDPAGNPVSVTDSPTMGAVDAQCYAYDGLARLTSAWTPGDGDCETAASVAGLGGPAPYWTDYAFDQVGSRTTVTEHAAGGDTVSTYAYPVPGGDGAHQVDSVTHVGPGGTTTDTFEYDPAGNTTTRALAGEPVQSLVWDAEGELAEVLEDDATVGEYLYSADGERLVRRQDGATTVYLPGGQELTVERVTGQVTATRYYVFNGHVVATRTDPGITGAAVLVSDPHGTAELTVDGTGAVTRRRTDPYGNPRGTAPAAWPGDHGFLDKPVDDTGLVAIGARYYDPATGRFASVDPVMDLTDPQQWHGYTYANNNPITYTDPTGLTPYTPGGTPAPKANNYYTPAGAPKVAKTTTTTKPPIKKSHTPAPPPPSTVEGSRHTSQFGKVSDFIASKLAEWRGSEDARRMVEIGAAHGDLLNKMIPFAIRHKNGDAGGSAQAIRHTLSNGKGGFLVKGMLYDMARLFGDDGEWDAKRPLRERYDITFERNSWLDMGNGQEMYFDVPGNVTYGYMAAEMGVNLENALLASREAGNPDPQDDVGVRLGHQLFDRNPGGVTADEFYKFMTSPSTLHALEEVDRIRPRQ
jgi:RHS repeat-associated protein